ncbi:MAG: tyrosine-type recombinase/integrase [Candidatus Limnocylindrales bacterium]
MILNYQGRGCAKSTIRQVEQVLRELAAVGVKQTSQITDEAISRWIQAWPDRTPETLKSHLRCISSLCTRAKKHGFLRLDPFDVDSIGDWVRQDGRPSAPRRRWSKSADEVRRVLSLADIEASGGSWEAGRLRAYVYTLFLTGGRPGEIQRLNATDFDRDAKTLWIHAKWITGRGARRYWWRPKTVGSSAILPIGEGLVSILDVWSRRCGSEWLFPGRKLYGPWTSGGRGVRPLDQVRSLGERAGVPGLANKAGRKGIGTHKEIGLTPMERREYFRHCDDATGDFYDDERVESMRPAAAKIEQFYLRA